MRIRNYVTVVCIAGISIGCTEMPKDTNLVNEITEEKVFTAESLAAEISSLEMTLNQPNTVNKEQIRRELIDFYNSFSKTFSTSKLTPDYLFKAGNESVNLKEYNNALNYYDRIDQHYSDYLKRPESLFIQGFIYDSYKDEYGKAKEKYERLIQLYPNHLLSVQAKQSITNLGLTDEEIIRKFEKQNK